jgi:hypothetical protein
MIYFSFNRRYFFKTNIYRRTKMLSKTIKTILSGSKLPLTFIGGVAFGTLGLKVLASKEAKKFYAKTIATGYKAKDSIDETISNIKQHADDVLADAGDIYEAEKKEADLDFVEGK